MEASCDIRVEDGISCPVKQDMLASDVNHVLACEGIQRPCLVSISIVSDAQMQILNKNWRGKDQPTDVLSLECERPDDPDLAPGEPCELGDIVLAPNFIADQARRFDTTTQDELRLLLVHGMLHLLGYDHIADDEAAVMEAREDAILAGMNLDHVPDHVHFTRHKSGEDE